MRYFWIWGVLTCAVFSGIARADMLIIAHKDVPETTLSAKHLQEMFLGKRAQWKDGAVIYPATSKDPHLHEMFLDLYMQKSISQWVAHWKRQVFTGNGTPPEQFATQAELLEYVANTPGAIGYIDSETPVEKVTIIEIQ